MALPNISLGVINFICDVARYGNRGKPVEIDEINTAGWVSP